MSKKNAEEKKICTLYVSDKYRGLGIGTLIIEESIKWLGTTKPRITLTGYKLEIFKPFIDKYGWELTKVVADIYNNRDRELVFNGTLEKNKETSEQQIMKEK